MKRSIKFIAMFLIIAMLFTMLTSFAPANSSISVSELNADEFVLPDIVKASEAEANGYVGRVKEKETDLYTFVFSNSDGTNTMKVYSYPVKYVDDNGTIKDISTDVEKLTDGSFRTQSNNIVTTFSRKLSDGITLEYNDIEITMKPSLDNISMWSKLINKTVASSSDNETISYPYGTDTALEYELTYTGFKEDIVVSEYTGQTEYEFTLYTNGLYLVENNGSFYLADESNEIRATIGDIIIFTADERNNTMGSMTAKTVSAGNEYVLTIHIDADYLKDEKTAYPIRIDPTIEINYNNNGAGAIDDVTINSVDQLSGTAGSLCLGKYAEDNSVSRILMRFPALDFTQLTYIDLLLNASVEIRDLIPGTAATEVECFVFRGNEWTESTANWATVSPDSIYNILSTHTVSYASGSSQPDPHWYSFDITSAVKGWFTGIYYEQSKGILFKASDTTENGTAHVYKTFASFERATYKPVLTLRYRDVITQNTISTVPYSAQFTLAAEKAHVFTFVPSVTSDYSAWTVGYLDTKIHVFTNSEYVSTPIVTNDDVDRGEDSEEINASVTFSCTAGTTYYIVVQGFHATTSGQYTLKLYRGLPISGSEVPYQPNLWNYGDEDDGPYDEYIQKYTNCYAYALNTQVDPDGGNRSFLRLGQSEFEDTDLYAKNSTDLLELILTSIQYDSDNWGLDLEEIGRTSMAPEGTYKVALVLDEYYDSEVELLGCDFHWYRQNPDGTWSHKQGSSYVRNVDASGNIIYDPYYADRDHGQYNYNIFIGYYCVRPLNTMYESDD